MSLTRADTSGYSFQADRFRIVSVVRGQGVVTIEGIDRPVSAHVHFGVPGGMTCTIRQTGDDPLVALDALIKGKE